MNWVLQLNVGVHLGLLEVAVADVDFHHGAPRLGGPSPRVLGGRRRRRRTRSGNASAVGDGVGGTSMVGGSRDHGRGGGRAVAGGG